MATHIRTVTPRLKVVTGPGLSIPDALIRIEDGQAAYVSSDGEAREVLSHLGLDECCVEDRISVSHGGPVLCDH